MSSRVDIGMEQSIASATAVPNNRANSASRSPLPFQTPGEEIANSVIHGLGAAAAIAGLVLLLVKACDGWETVSYAIYGTSMILLFLASTLYHGLTHEGAKRVFRVLDHAAIYLLIAGTYTPFCLVALRGTWGWTLFVLEWSLAAIGITLYASGSATLKKIEVGVYILMGWAIVVGGRPLFAAIPAASSPWLIAGGIAYTLGTIWYGRKARRGSHVAWHVFVFLGAFCHFWAVMFL
jgi:hemolysin III